MDNLKLPIVIIKKILRLLTSVDYKNLKTYLLISKGLRDFILTIINGVVINNKRQLNQITKVKLYNGQYFKDYIKKVILDTIDFKPSPWDQIKNEDLSEFKNLKLVTIKLLNNIDLTETSKIVNNSKYKTKFRSFGSDSPYKIVGSNNPFINLKKLTLPTCNYTLPEVTNHIVPSKNLKSIDISINPWKPQFILAEDRDFDRESDLFFQSLKDLNLKKLSLRDRRVYTSNSSEYLNMNQFALPEYSYFITVLNSTIPLLNLSKLHLYGIFIEPNNFFNSLSQSKSLKITKLKLVSTNLKEENVFGELIHYLTEINKEIKNLSIRKNFIRTSNQNKMFMKYLRETNTLQKLDVSYNYFDCKDIFAQVISKRNQLSNITISDLTDAPHDLLVSSNILNDVQVKYSGGLRNEVLTNNKVKEIKNNMHCRTAFSYF
ncbi:hypothetical protein DICPUDRAFT_77260 [Dictyostelium purpureum]|uniref:F-box domain-containing protein n=1 Tax=Dictyostelium purpureum TaxID=5786 RepID=F0ZG35_DICPU|nr:uncharacterized protein DICPUDRAFT_77260 [Dictyostelium purpureum]EGC37090.1 hypothetical protein DICPUDRAFT_77260 [Dictyostelium purpureum]|eukprot:XP_003286371.1 hypothetical protein DICPUDRAFT_77260 [Dictyostelium purpureum]